MKRKYTNTEKETVADFFYGIEVENSPAHGMETLFVRGVHTITEILTFAEPTPAVKTLYLGRDAVRVTHIYCGANQSFAPATNSEWTDWTIMIFGLLDQGFWVTLDFDVKFVQSLLDFGLTEHRKFIPMISVKLPYVNLFNYNTTIKIDDIGFEETNPGVWCHRLHDLMGTEKFTSWDKYNDDKVIQ